VLRPEATRQLTSCYVVVELRGFEPLTPCMPCHPHPFMLPSEALPGTTSALLREVAGQGAVVRRDVACGIAADNLLTKAPAFSRDVRSCGLLLRRIPRVVRGRVGSRAWWRSAAARLTGPAWHSIPMTRLRKVAMTWGRPTRSWGVLGEGDVADVVQRLYRVLPHDRAFQRTPGPWS
jgi:hypothetical protein